jgi:hypothetical protein
MCSDTILVKHIYVANCTNERLQHEPKQQEEQEQPQRDDDEQASANGSDGATSSTTNELKLAEMSPVVDFAIASRPVNELVVNL